MAAAEAATVVAAALAATAAAAAGVVMAEAGAATEAGATVENGDMDGMAAMVIMVVAGVMVILTITGDFMEDIHIMIVPHIITHIQAITTITTAIHMIAATMMVATKIY